MGDFNPWAKYDHLPRNERNRRIEEDSQKVSRQSEESQKRAWGPEGKKFEAFGGDYN